MTSPIDTEADLAAALARLVAQDTRLAGVLDIAGTVPLRRGPAGFEGLIRIVTGQQLSTASAEAIWGRLRAAYEPFEHHTLARAGVAKLQRLGLSTPKIRTVKAIAAAVKAGEIDFAALAAMPSDEAHAALVAVHGIGPWTADIYLLFCLGHADAWPAGDLALQEAVRIAFALDARPSAKAMVAMGETWRPWRGVAAKLLWSYYRVVKRRDPAPA